MNEFAEFLKSQCEGQTLTVKQAREKAQKARVSVGAQEARAVLNDMCLCRRASKVGESLYRIHDWRKQGK